MKGYDIGTGTTILNSSAATGMSSLRKQPKPQKTAKSAPVIRATSVARANKPTKNTNFTSSSKRRGGGNCGKLNLPFLSRIILSQPSFLPCGDLTENHWKCCGIPKKNHLKPDFPSSRLTKHVVVDNFRRFFCG